MKKEVLIFLNTDYHVETALSLYQTIILEGHNPSILLDYDLEAGDFELENFLKEHGIKYLTTKTFDESINKDSFDKMIVVTASHNGRIESLNESSPPINYNNRMKMFKDKAVLVYHRANYKNYSHHAQNFFDNPKCISATKFSQRFGLDYFYQVENPIAEKEIQKTTLNSILNYIVIGRFNLSNRDFHILKSLPNIDEKLDRKIKIDFIGQEPTDEKFNFLIETTFKNIELNFHFNLNQKDFYEKIYNSDFFLNLVHGSFYFKDRFTSNINHIIAFSKPNVTPLLLNLIYNIPGLNYTKDFGSIFLESINLDNELYKNMISNFKIVKNNMRSHNHFVFNKLLQ